MWILKQEMKHVKKIGAILLLNKMKSGAKREWFFCSYSCFLESEKLRWEKFCKRAKFFVHEQQFKAVFFKFFVKSFGYDFILIIGWFWQWFEDY